MAAANTAHSNRCALNAATLSEREPCSVIEYLCAVILSGGTKPTCWPVADCPAAMREWNERAVAWSQRSHMRIFGLCVPVAYVAAESLLTPPRNP